MNWPKSKKYRWGYVAQSNIDRQLKKDGSFADNHPELLDEWDYQKNINGPETYTRGSAKKVWWICRNRHSWKASIGSRTRKDGGTGCGKCSGYGTSKLELRIFAEINHLFKNVKYHKYIDKIEIDIFLQDYNLGIEPDGYIHHKNKKFDLKKNIKLKKKKINLIRIRDHRLPKLSKNDILLKGNSQVKFEDTKRLVLSIKKQVKLNTHDKKNVEKYLLKKNFIAEKHYNELISNLPSPVYELSLEYKYPELSKEWHPTKNFPMQPSMFTHGSSYKAWWICIRGHKDFKAHISHRTGRGDDCIECGKIKIKETQRKNIIKKRGSLKENYPDLALMFMEEKNGISSKDIHCHGGVKYWFYCKKHDYEFEYRIDKLISKKKYCRYCSEDLGWRGNKKKIK